MNQAGKAGRPARVAAGPSPAATGVVAGAAPAPMATGTPITAAAAAPEPAVPAPIEPVADGEYMVLVAQLERLGGSERDLRRFVADDLRRTFEDEVALSNIRVRTSDQIVTSDAAAQQLAEASGATVMIWGNYDDQTVELNVQVGSTAAFRSIAVPRDVLNRLGNLQIELSDPRRQTVAPQVLTVLNALQTADGNGYEVLRVVAIRAELDNQGVQMVGNSTAARFDRYLGAYFAQTERARDEIDQALLVDAANPLLYVYRSVANMWLGQLDAARQDADAAERLGPAGWTSPLYLSGFGAYITGDLTASLELFSQIVAARPDDWFPVNYRGSLHYLRGEYPVARDDLQRAIELGPNANFPYVFATMLALRAGQIDEAKALIATTVANYPDPTLANRTISGLFGPNTPNLFGPTFSAFGNLGLGRYTAVLSDTAAALEIAPELVDLHFMQGYAYCNLGQYAEAEAAYARALELDPGFTMLYLLRAEARQGQQNLPGALADIAAVQSSPQAAQFAPLVAQAQAGRLSCETFLK